MAIERSLWAPDFSRYIMTARIFAGSIFSCVSWGRDGGSAPRMRGRHGGAAGVAARRVEREADNGAPFAHDVSDDRHHRGRHLGEIETRIADVRLQRDRAFADVDDTHGVYFNSC